MFSVVRQAYNLLYLQVSQQDVFNVLSSAQASTVDEATETVIGILQLIFFSCVYVLLASEYSSTPLATLHVHMLFRSCLSLLCLI